MTSLLIGAIATVIVGIFAGIAGFTNLMKFIQDSATAIAQVNTFEETFVQLNMRVATLEEKVGKVETDNSNLIIQNTLLMSQNTELLIKNKTLIEQNGYLMRLLGDPEDLETEETFTNGN